MQTKDFYDKTMVDFYTKEYEKHYVQKPLLIDTIKKHLSEGSTILELGSGTGEDYKQLSDIYKVLGSDYSIAFLKLLETRYGSKFLRIDASDFVLEKSVDAIFSNKVLHHLSPELLTKSFQCQYNALAPNGIVEHSFWYGEGHENFNGMDVYSYTQEKIQELAGDHWCVKVSQRYKEFDDDDSLLVVLQKN